MLYDFDLEQQLLGRCFIQIFKAHLMILKAKDREKLFIVVEIII